MSGFSAKTYEYSGETTEWEDILIKKGIRMKESILEEKGLNPADYMDKYKVKEEEEELTEDPMASATLEQLKELEDDGFDDEKALQEYREARLAELREKRLRERFGSVQNIEKGEWTKEVNEVAVEGQWVIVHMYQDHIIECRLVDEAFELLAAKFKYIKFVRIKSTSAVENWPDRNLPMIFMYEDGEARDQIMTLSKLGKKSFKPADLEWALVKKGIVTDSELVDDPRSQESQLESNEGSPGGRRHVHARPGRQYLDSDEEEDDDDDDENYR